MSKNEILIPTKELFSTICGSLENIFGHELERKILESSTDSAFKLQFQTNKYNYNLKCIDKFGKYSCLLAFAIGVFLKFACSKNKLIEKTK